MVSFGWGILNATDYIIDRKENPEIQPYDFWRILILKQALPGERISMTKDKNYRFFPVNVDVLNSTCYYHIAIIIHYSYRLQRVTQTGAQCYQRNPLLTHYSLIVVDDRLRHEVTSDPLQLSNTISLAELPSNGELKY